MLSCKGEKEDGGREEKREEGRGRESNLEVPSICNNI